MKINALEKGVLEVGFDSAVKRIEIERADTPTTHWKTVRFTTIRGEILEVSCDAEWLVPEVYTGKSLHELELDQA